MTGSVSTPEYCFKQKSVVGQVVTNIPKITLPTTTATPVQVITDVPRITFPTTTATPDKVVNNVPHITIPTTTATPVKILKDAVVKPVTISTTVNPSATDSQQLQGEMKRNSDLNSVPVSTPSAQNTLPQSVIAPAQNKGIVDAILSFLFGWNTPRNSGQINGTISVTSPTSGLVYNYGDIIPVRFDPVPASVYTQYKSLNMDIIQENGPVLYSRYGVSNDGSSDWDLDSQFNGQQLPSEQLTGEKRVWIEVHTPGYKFTGRSGMFTLKGSQPIQKPHGPIQILSPKMGDTVYWGKRIAVRWDPSFDPNEEKVIISIKPSQTEGANWNGFGFDVVNTGSAEIDLPKDCLQSNGDWWGYGDCAGPRHGTKNVWLKIDDNGKTPTTSWVEVNIQEAPLKIGDDTQARDALGNALKATTEIKVTSPGSGDIVEVTGFTPIRWDTSYSKYLHTEADDHISIDLYSADGFQLDRLCNDTPNNGFFYWSKSFTFFAANSDKPCYIKLTAGEKSGTSGIFTLGKAGIISVTAPDSGDIIYSPDPVTVKWVAPAGYDTINMIFSDYQGHQYGTVYHPNSKPNWSISAPNWGTFIVDPSIEQMMVRNSPTARYQIAIYTPDGKYQGNSTVFTIGTKPDILDRKGRAPIPQKEVVEVPASQILGRTYWLAADNGEDQKDGYYLSLKSPNGYNV
jgi:hypothetical protein